MQSTESKEAKLLEGCIKKDRKDQRALFDQFAPGMHVVALRYSKNGHEAEDILQEAFVKVFDKIDQFRGESSLAFWIKRIVINTALNYQRSKLYMFPMVDVTELNREDTQGDIIAHLGFEELLTMIQELPTGCQVVFNLYAIEGYKHYEIAEMLEISVGTSKSQYARAKSLLKTAVEQKYDLEYGKL